MADLRDVPPEPEPAETPPATASPAAEPAGIRWRQLRKLGAQLFPTTSPYGKPTAFAGSTHYLAVGTYSADVLVFDYNQTLLLQLSARDATSEMLGAVTSVGISDDETHLVVGFGLGAVVLWEIKKGGAKLLSLVLPSEHGATHGDGLNKYATNASHLKGVPVIRCGVLKLAGTKTTVSVDASGVVIRHKFKRILVEYSTRSVRVLGDPARGRSILDCALAGNILALQTQDLLLVVALGASSVDNLCSVVLKIPRSRDSAASYGRIQHGCVALYPQAGLPLLLYSWNSDLKLLDLNSQSALAAYTHNPGVEHLAFLTRELAIVASGRQIHVLSFSENPGISDDGIVVSSGSPPIVQLQIHFHSIFILGSYDFQVGQLANWADQLLNLLNAGEPAKAIKLALNFYYTEGDLSIVGLPADRQAVISQALPDLVLTALRFSIQFDPEHLGELMPQALRAVVLINPELLDAIAELVEESESLHLFYTELATLVRDGLVHWLPPNVFRQLVITNPDSELFYKLDLSTLDLDLAFKLCKVYENALADVKIYLETCALHDYLSPLAGPRVFEYLKLVLTSRIYPTEEELQDADTAKRVLYTALFLQEHPLYADLMAKDEQQFFDMLTTAFEDSWLNENSEINRQIILSFLLVHVSLDSFYFCAFIAQNYSKYPQFLAASQSVTQKVLTTLCTSTADRDTAQLSILSLLSTYKPRDPAKLIAELREARYTTVLKHVLSRANKYAELAQIELDLQEPSLWETLGMMLVKNRAATHLFLQTHFDALLRFDSARLGKFVAQHAFDDLWVPNLEFMRSAFAELRESGGVLPPPAVRADFVNLLARESGPELISVLEHCFVGSRDVELPLVVDTLLETQHVDALTILLSRQGRHAEAMIYVRNHIRETDLSPADLNHYVELGANICREAGSTELWEQLLETLAARGLQDHVKYVTNTIAESSSSALPAIVRRMLDAKQDVGAVVRQGYVVLARKLAMWQSFWEIAERENLHELLDLIKAKKEGWIVSIDSECEVCGHKIVGLGIDAQQVYQDWEAAMKGDKTGDGLLLFRCMHAYHYGCLKRMAPVGLCIVCYP